MRLGRRDLLFGLAALTGCAPPRAGCGDVIAAGQPAAILVLALAGERLIGWPRRPSPEALALLPPSADLPELGALRSGGAVADAEAVVALSPALILDYGDTQADDRAVERRVRTRLGIPYRLIDGSLVRTPEALTLAGDLLGVPARGRELADRAGDVVARWHRPGEAGPSFYYARGRDGLETGFAGALATEVLEGGGWRNVAVGGQDIGRVSRERVAAWDPEVLVTLDAGFARAARADRFWHRRVAGSPRRILWLPDLPFGWIDRPPSINRLLGCAWLAAGATSRVDASTVAMAREFARNVWGRDPGEAAARALVPRWFA